MPATLQIGTAHSKPGDIVYGTFTGMALPTGGNDHLPVIIAQGATADGPVLWLTANIHGAEYNGIAVIHHVLTPNLVANLTGTIVAVPTLNPAGLRTAQRSPYYLYGRDPNRLFPDPTNPNEHRDTAGQSPVETVYANLFEHIDATADYLIDLHDYGIDSIPFVFRDPILYYDERDRIVANRLQATVGEMVKSLGLTVINEYASNDYIKLNLHRSVSGSVLNLAHIPAVTIEIGGQQRITPPHVRAVAAGLRNVLRWAEMLPGSAEPIVDIPVIDLGYPVRRSTHPRAPAAGIVQPLVRPGDHLSPGTRLARIVDLYGRPVGRDDGVLRAEQEGFVIGLFPGVAVYPNDAIVGIAIRDKSNLVIKYSQSEHTQ